MLSKNKFIEVINEFKSIEFDIESASDALKKLDPNFGGLYLSRITNLTLNLLSEAVNDKYDYISYFIYDLNYGKSWKKGMITDKNKKDIKFGF